MRVVISKAVEIPFIMHIAGKEYSFAPVAEVPDALAAEMIKNRPDLYRLAEGEVSTDGYTFKDVWKNKTISEIVDTLSDKAKLQVFELAKSLAKAGEVKAPAPLPPPPAVRPNPLKASRK